MSRQEVIAELEIALYAINSAIRHQVVHPSNQERLRASRERLQLVVKELMRREQDLLLVSEEEDVFFLKGQWLLDTSQAIPAVATYNSTCITCGQPNTGPHACPGPEQTEFTVVLANAGVERFKVITLVREVAGLGLLDAKVLVDSAPKTLKEGLSKRDAEDVRSQFASIGATIELK